MRKICENRSTKVFEIFESLRKKSKKLLHNTSCKISKRCKEIVGCNQGDFPKRMIIDGQEIIDQGKIVNCFNKFFADIDPKLASMILESQTKFDQYLNPH